MLLESNRSALVCTSSIKLARTPRIWMSWARFFAPIPVLTCPCKLDWSRCAPPPCKLECLCCPGNANASPICAFWVALPPPNNRFLAQTGAPCKKRPTCVSTCKNAYETHVGSPPNDPKCDRKSFRGSPARRSARKSLRKVIPMLPEGILGSIWEASGHPRRASGGSGGALESPWLRPGSGQNRPASPQSAPERI